MVCFVNVESVDRIIYSIFQRFNLEWKNRILKLFTQAASHTQNNTLDTLLARGYNSRRFLHDCGNPTERSSLLCGQLAAENAVQRHSRPKVLRRNNDRMEARFSRGFSGADPIG
jgi:hypothetical protein